MAEQTNLEIDRDDITAGDYVETCNVGSKILDEEDTERAGVVKDVVTTEDDHGMEGEQTFVVLTDGDEEHRIHINWFEDDDPDARVRVTKYENTGDEDDADGSDGRAATDGGRVISNDFDAEHVLQDLLESDEESMDELSGSFRRYLFQRDFDTRPVSGHLLALIFRDQRGDRIARASAEGWGAMVWMDECDSELLDQLTETAEYYGHSLKNIRYRESRVRGTEGRQLRVWFDADRDDLAIFGLLQRYGLTSAEIFDYWGHDVRRGGDRPGDEWRQMRQDAVSRQALHDARERAKSKLPKDVRDYLENGQPRCGVPLERLTPPEAVDGAEDADGGDEADA